MKAIVVDKDYGSVSARELMEVQESYKQAGIELEAYHFQKKSWKDAEVQTQFLQRAILL